MTAASADAVLRGLAAARGRAGIVSVCSAHPLVIEAAIARANRTGNHVLIEATCHQVNHHSGYSGETPASFRAKILAIAEKIGLTPEKILFGGDHLGPLPWRDAPAATACSEAASMIRAYVRAGFQKIHLDASMACADDPPVLDEAIMAERAVHLAAVAEETAREVGLPAPVYVIGTEVPPAGGGRGEIAAITPTDPVAARASFTLHRECFAARGLDDAFARVIAMVVQPGIEFDNVDVAIYDPAKVGALPAMLDRMPGRVFEAHSTDYQPVSALRALVADGFAILKVGPALTFALREALYALDGIAAFLDGGDAGSLRAVMEKLMMARPEFWKNYATGDDAAQKIQRHYGYSDRIRYYWQEDDARGCVEALLARFPAGSLPAPLIHQFLPALYPRVASGEVFSGRGLVLAMIDLVLGAYEAAIS